MRHQCKKHHLGLAADQRRAMLRSLVSSLFIHEEIQTTMARAKALKPYAESIITFAKKGDLAARREALKAKVNDVDYPMLKIWVTKNDGLLRKKED